MNIKLIGLLIVLVQNSPLPAQHIIDWDGNYQLQLSDFQSPSTQLQGSSIKSITSGAGFDFAFHMSNAEFVFTKNFNSNVNCSFNCAISSIVAPDSVHAMDLLLFARYQFDLAELYARKVRARLYEVKGAFSNTGFFKPVFQEFQQEYARRYAEAMNATNLGENREVLLQLHNEVLDEIAFYPEFCKACKPKKKKK